MVCGTKWHATGYTRQNEGCPSRSPDDWARAAAPRNAMEFRQQTTLGLDVASANQKRPPRTQHAQEAACQGAEDLEGAAVRALHASPHVSNSTGRVRLRRMDPSAYRWAQFNSDEFTLRAPR